MNPDAALLNVQAAKNLVERTEGRSDDDESQLIGAIAALAEAERMLEALCRPQAGDAAG